MGLVQKSSMLSTMLSKNCRFNFFPIPTDCESRNEDKLIFLILYHFQIFPTAFLDGNDCSRADALDRILARAVQDGQGQVHSNSLEQRTIRCVV